MIPSQSEEPLRVCNECYSNLTKNTTNSLTTGGGNIESKTDPENTDTSDESDSEDAVVKPNNGTNNTNNQTGLAETRPAADLNNEVIKILIINIPFILFTSLIQN